MTLAPPPPRAPACASDLDLDELLSGDLAGQPKELQLRAHVQECARCGARLHAFSAIAPPPLAATTDAPEKLPPPVRRRRSGRWLLAVGLALPAVAALMLGVRLSRPNGPTEVPGERTKGDLGLSLFVKRASGAIDQITGQGTLRAGEEMRFELASGRPGDVVVLGLDAAGSVTVYAPGPGSAQPIHVPAGVRLTLPGSIVADATPGFERVLAVRCDAGSASADRLSGLARAALAAAQGRPDHVTGIGSGCAEASVLLHKDGVGP